MLSEVLRESGKAFSISGITVYEKALHYWRIGYWENKSVGHRIFEGT
jgi:hypothetical protein